jgi:hypothetical protein
MTHSANDCSQLKRRRSACGRLSQFATRAGRSWSSIQQGPVRGINGRRRQRKRMAAVGSTAVDSTAESKWLGRWETGFGRSSDHGGPHGERGVVARYLVPLTRVLTPPLPHWPHANLVAQSGMVVSAPYHFVLFSDLMAATFVADYTVPCSAARNAAGLMAPYAVCRRRRASVEC